MSAALTPAQARTLLLVSLAGQTLTQITDRLAERGQLTARERLKADLSSLAALGLVDVEKGRGREGWRYRLASGAAVDEALDHAYGLRGQAAKGEA